MIAVLENPKAATAEFRLPEMQAAARALGVQVQMLAASTVGEIESAYAKLGQQWVGALLISSDPLFVAQHEKLIALSARNAVPTIFGSRESAIAGGLFSYGASIDDAYRLGGVYVGRILQGAKPADLPVQQAVKVELVLNLKTAKMLGLTIPQEMLLRADEVIE